MNNKKDPPHIIWHSIFIIGILFIFYGIFSLRDFFYIRKIDLSLSFPILLWIIISLFFGIILCVFSALKMKKYFEYVKEIKLEANKAKVKANNLTKFFLYYCPVCLYQTNKFVDICPKCNDGLLNKVK